MKRAVIGCIVALGLVVGGGAGAAFAGETNGNGDPVPGAHKASSACAFSGQDLPDSIENNPPGRNDDATPADTSRATGSTSEQETRPCSRAPATPAAGTWSSGAEHLRIATNDPTAPRILRRGRSRAG
jgi:hypothetical protein